MIDTMVVGGTFHRRAVFGADHIGSRLNLQTAEPVRQGGERMRRSAAQERLDMFVLERLPMLYEACCMQMLPLSMLLRHVRREATSWRSALPELDHADRAAVRHQLWIILCVCNSLAMSRGLGPAWTLLVVPELAAAFTDADSREPAVDGRRHDGV
jgi:hypothetical protein